MKPILRFGADHTFTIVQFTDIHWKNGEPEDLLSRKCMETVLDLEQPDLVVFTGDLIYSGEADAGYRQCQDPVQAFKDVVSVAESRGIRWAFVFGNHDTEGDITREELMDVAMQHTYNCAEHGPTDIHGVGNYTLPLFGHNGDETAAVLYFLDSGENPSILLSRAMTGSGAIRSVGTRWRLRRTASSIRAARCRRWLSSIFHCRSTMRFGSVRRVMAASMREFAVRK